MRDLQRTSDRREPALRGWCLLTSNPVSDRVAVNVHIDEGQRYRLREIIFKNNRAISNVQALRKLFPLKDGDVFDRVALAEGLSKLRFAYLELGYINFTPVPDTRFNEEDQAISIDIDFDEGTQFRIRSLNFLGLDQAASHNVLKDLPLLRPGKIYNQRLANLALKEHGPLPPTDAASDSRIHLQLDERTATVAITLDFRPCPLE